MIFEIQFSCWLIFRLNWLLLLILYFSSTAMIYSLIHCLGILWFNYVHIWIIAYLNNYLHISWIKCTFNKEISYVAYYLLWKFHIFHTIVKVFWQLWNFVKAGNCKSFMGMKVKMWNSETFSPWIISNIRYLIFLIRFFQCGQWWCHCDNKALSNFSHNLIYIFNKLIF